jgi:hypothetical protein
MVTSKPTTLGGLPASYRIAASWLNCMVDGQHNSVEFFIYAVL